MKFFDWHCDTLSKSEYTDKCTVTQAGMDSFDETVQTFAIYTSDRLSEDDAYLSAKRQLAVFTKSKFSTSILSIENSKMLIYGAKTLEKFREAGVFLFSLTHNSENQYAYGCSENGGLKPAGKELLLAANELGVTLDISHLSEKGVYQALDIFKGPVVASHSCFSAVYSHRRNLSDKLAHEIFERGGFVGVNIYPDFLGGQTLDDVVKHIEHAFLIGGGKHVAFGCDMDGIEKMPIGIDKYDDIKKIADLMLKKGFSQSQIDDIFYNNSYNFVKENGYLEFLQYQKLKA